MTAIERADELTQQAVAILIAARQDIDERLHRLGHDDGAVKRRGRPPKAPEIKNTPSD